MKKRLILSIIAFLCIIPAKAQLQLGIKAGYLYDQPVVNTQYAYTRNYYPGSGALFAIPIQYDFFDWFGLVVEPQVQFRQTGYKLATWHSESQYNLMMDFPIMANFSWGGEKIRGFVNVGGYTGVWLNSWANKCEINITSTPTELSEKRQFNNNDNRFDGGITGGIGLRWFNDKKVNMSLEYRYYYGLSSYQKTHADGNTYGFYNNMQAVTLGVHFNNLGRKSK